MIDSSVRGVAEQFLSKPFTPTTATVMAAGNYGQVSNARHALTETTSLALVEAEDSSGNFASYSNRVDSGHAAAVRIFGGDAADTTGRATIFEHAPDSYGTSYAAPFVTAATYAYWAALGGADVRFDSAIKGKEDFGEFCKREIGSSFSFRPSSLPEVERVRARELV